MRVDINIPQIAGKLDKCWKDNLSLVSEQALKDSNYYARQDQGTMIASSQTATDFKGGHLVWNTPYAKRVYYTGKPSHSVNANASLMWAERAKREHIRDWEKIAQKAYQHDGS